MIRLRRIRAKPRRVAAACIGAVAVLAGACAPPRTAPILPGAAPSVLPATVRVGGIEGHPGEIREMPIEEYVLASILTEVAPARAEPAALERLFEVQAIVARTYAAANPGRHAAQGYDLCTSTHCQLVDFRRPATSSWRAEAERAVARTSGLILVYDGRPAQTVFHADCGGHTSAAAAVWGGTPRPYLRGVRDDLPGGARHQTWRFDVAADELRAALDHDARTAVGARLSTIEVAERDRGGRILLLRLRGSRDVTIRAEDFRAVVSQALGAHSIRSTWFDIHRRPGGYVFDGRGFGHGVGLCQAGALARAAAGRSPSSILAFYYPDTRVLAAGPASVRPGHVAGRLE